LKIIFYTFEFEPQKFFCNVRNISFILSSGFVQFIDSIGVADILAADGSIQNFLKKHAPMEGAPYGIAPEVMDNYVKSCGMYFF
jgi:hypothetical protein